MQQVYPTIPNIVMGDEADSSKLVPNNEYLQFILQCAQLYPQWTFKLDSLVRKEFIEPRWCYVYAKDEKLGEISRSYSRGKNVIVLENDRISKELCRGSSMSTSDHGKALRLIKKYFFRRTVDELVREASAHADHLVSRIRSAKRREFISSFNDASKDLFMRFLTDHQNLMEKYAQEKGIDPNIVRSLIHGNEEVEIVEGISTCLENKNGAVVLLHGQSYVVKSAQQQKIYEVGDVPDIIKRQVGMLKLVEDGQFITNTGVRVNDKTFFITLKEVV